jgi:hypothetical protein
LIRQQWALPPTRDPRHLPFSQPAYFRTISIREVEGALEAGKLARVSGRPLVTFVETIIEAIASM